MKVTRKGGERKEGKEASKKAKKEVGGRKEGREGEREGESDRGRYGRRKEQLQKKEVRTLVRSVTVTNVLKLEKKTLEKYL